MSDAAVVNIRCPTCGAKQTAAAECRRCKCDLRQYLSALEECRHWKKLALCYLRDGRFAAAANAAQHLWERQPGEEAARLCATAQLLAGHYDEALAIYKRTKSAAQS